MKNTSFFSISMLILMALGIFSCQHPGRAPENQKSLPSHRPFTYWWWHGNAVDSANIAYNLEMMHKAGIGGAHIVPIYGVKGEEKNFIDYLSPRWIDMVNYSSQKARELGMEIDMTLGTGWCFGGSWVEPENGVMNAFLEKVENGHSGSPVDLTSNSSHPIDTIMCVLAESETGQREDITLNLKDHTVTVPEHLSPATLYILRMTGPARMVKRAAPGAEGPMLNPLSQTAFDAYSSFFKEAFGAGLNNALSSIYHDSYEYSNAKWSPDFFAAFEKNRGYRLQKFLPELMDKGQTEISRRIITDYRQTAFELHHEYIKAVSDWAKKYEVTFRNQAHGSPANWLDIYSLADIPETESFGSSPFQIPGLQRKKEFISEENVPLRDVYKFASSAAHVTGKTLVSCETHTWLREHFRVALSQCKPELDKLFSSGINRIYYHGTAYSPKEAPWPGWLFYASTNFAPSNSQHAHFPAQNAYIQNCQRILQQTTPDNEILVYFPFQDILHTLDPHQLIKQITVHNAGEWYGDTEFQKTLLTLRKNGFGYDYISDRQLHEATGNEKGIKTSGHSYKTLIVPRCTYMPVQTLEKLQKMIQKGVNILFIDQLPETLSGYDGEQTKSPRFVKTKNELMEITLPNLRVATHNELSGHLSNWGLKQEDLARHQLDFIRKKNMQGGVYFIANLNSGKEIDDFIPVATDGADYVLYDPLTGKKGKAKIQAAGNQNEVYIQLKQGESVFLFVNKKQQNFPEWKYTGKEIKKYPVEGTWDLDFLEGGPSLPRSVKMDTLTSWTNLADPMASFFSGTAKYTLDFQINDFNPENQTIMEFEKVCESVSIQMNGEKVTTLFSHPFEANITPFLKKGLNHLELEVANLPANRIRYLDINNVEWQKFYNINFVNIDYQEFDASGWEPVESGLTGKVWVVEYERK